MTRNEKEDILMNVAFGGLGAVMLVLSVWGAHCCIEFEKDKWIAENAPEPLPMQPAQPYEVKVPCAHETAAEVPGEGLIGMLKEASK